MFAALLPVAELTTVDLRIHRLNFCRALPSIGCDATDVVDHGSAGESSSHIDSEYRRRVIMRAYLIIEQKERKEKEASLNSQSDRAALGTEQRLLVIR